MQKAYKLLALKIALKDFLMNIKIKYQSVFSSFKEKEFVTSSADLFRFAGVLIDNLLKTCDLTTRPLAYS